MNEWTWVIIDGYPIFQCGSLEGALENCKRLRKEGYKTNKLEVQQVGLPIRFDADWFNNLLDKRKKS